MMDAGSCRYDAHQRLPFWKGSRIAIEGEGRGGGIRKEQTPA